MEYLIHKLDQGNFFYSAIATLAYVQFGMHELFARGIFLQQQTKHPDLNEFINSIKIYNFPKEVEEQIFQTHSLCIMFLKPKS